MYEGDNIEPEFLKRLKTNPFRTPDHYFDTVEDRIMNEIKQQAKKKTPASRIYQMLLPALGLAASFAIVLLLVKYPITHFTNKSMVKVKTTDSFSSDLFHNYAFNISLVDENTLFNAISTNEKADSVNINSEELLAYLSTDMTDLEIYSAIQH